MSDDIVTRLRETAGYVRTDGNTFGEKDCLEAADEIERLRQLTGRLATLLMPFWLLMTKDEQEMVLKAVRGD